MAWFIAARRRSRGARVGVHWLGASYGAESGRAGHAPRRHARGACMRQWSTRTMLDGVCPEATGTALSALRVNLDLEKACVLHVNGLAEKASLLRASVQTKEGWRVLASTDNAGEWSAAGFGPEVAAGELECCVQGVRGVSVTSRTRTNLQQRLSGSATLACRSRCHSRAREPTRWNSAGCLGRMGLRVPARP